MTELHHAEDNQNALKGLRSFNRSAPSRRNSKGSDRCRAFTSGKQEPGVLVVRFRPIADARVSADTDVMEAHGIDPVILGSLRKVRDELLFDLTDQTAPPPRYADPLWQAFKLLEQTIEAMTKASGIEEPQGQWIAGKSDQS